MYPSQIRQDTEEGGSQETAKKRKVKEPIKKRKQSERIKKMKFSQPFPFDKDGTGSSIDNPFIGLD